MKRLLTVVLLLSVCAFAKDRTWQTGKLVNVNIATGYAGKWTAYDVRVTVESDGFQYQSAKQVYAERDFPRLTENAAVKFSIDSNTLIVIDERGKEFKSKIAKKTALER